MPIVLPTAELEHRGRVGVGEVIVGDRGPGDEREERAAGLVDVAEQLA